MYKYFKTFLTNASRKLVNIYPSLNRHLNEAQAFIEHEIIKLEKWHKTWAKHGSNKAFCSSNILGDAFLGRKLLEHF